MKKLLAVILSSLLAVPSYAAFGAKTIWQVQTTGADTNGGGFDSGVGSPGTDESASGGAAITVTSSGSTGTGSPAFTATTHGPGNFIHIASGSGCTTGWFEILSQSSGTATFDHSMGTGTCVGVIGNPLASPGQAGGVKVAGNDVCIKNGTYSMTTASTNVSGGMVDDSTGGVDQTNSSQWIGYSTTCVTGNTDTKPLLQASGAISSFTILKASGNYVDFQNLSLDAASKTTSTGMELANNYTRASNIKAANCTVFGIKLDDSENSVFLNQAEVTGCTGAATAGLYIGSTAKAVNVNSHANATHGVQLTVNATCSHCFSWSNTGASSDGFNGLSVGYSVVYSVAYNNGRAGFDLTGNAGFGTLLMNDVAEANASVGFNSDGVKAGAFCWNCAGYNNNGTTSLSGQYSTTNLPNFIGYIANTTGTFFTNAASGDFSTNATANQGALIRAAGYPATFPGGTTANYIDVGVAQHQDPASSGSQHNSAYVQ